jgi:secreted trypsin-like serine protease
VLITAVAALALAGPAAAAPTARVIGGDKVAPSDFQARYSGVVSIQYRVTSLPAKVLAKIPDTQTHTCGGTLISPKLVVTAAHCVASSGLQFGNVEYEVLAGTPTLAATRTAAARVKIADIFVHPSFRATGSGGVYYGWYGSFGATPAEYDVAVLRLERALTGVTPMPLVAAGEDSAWGAGAGRSTGAVALGWGDTVAPFFPGHRAERSRPLRSVGLAIRSDRRCERSDEGLGSDAANFDADTMFCAGTADGPGKGNAALTPCFGDSGGPLLAPVADGSLRLVGITSWTPSAAPCAGWAVFTRIAGVRDWIASVPQDSDGPGGLTAPTNVAATGTDEPDELHLTWTASSSGAIAQYRVHRQALVGFPFFGLTGVNSPATLALSAVTGGSDTGIDVYGVEPQRPGQHETRVVRVDAQDTAGNRVTGMATKVAAPVDSARPGRPSKLRVQDRTAGRVALVWTEARDNDCVGSYRVQVRPAAGGAWRTNSTEPRLGCDPLAFGPYYGLVLPTGDGTRPLGRAFGSLRGLAAGDYLVRVLAVDRAGNVSAPSRALPAHLEQRVPRRRSSNRSCVQVGFGFYCSASASSRTVAVGGPVDVIVG